MYINHNSMAGNVSNTLTSHYNNLATSTQRLSSGLRVNSAADDAAGLAIRELMRADIASLEQGVRNANDAISLIQTADGALGIIDEKLIRMKELAEQAATGTYDSTQRLMIESEYQAMASEITRIANATDFNGIKLLNGNLSGTHDGSKLTAEGELKVHFGPGNDSAEDYYYIGVEEMTSQALGLGNASTWQDVQNRGTEAFRKELTDQIKNDKTLTDEQRGHLLDEVDKAVEQLDKNLTNATDYRQAHKYWGASDADPDEGFLVEGKEFEGASSLMADYMTAASAAIQHGGPTDVDKITEKITNAIKDALPVGNEVTWETDQAKFDLQSAELWTKVEEATRASAKEAGLTSDEINRLLFGDDGKGGMKKEWDDGMKTAPTGANAGAIQAAGDTLLSNTIDGMTTAQKKGGRSITEYMAADSPDADGNATNGELIVLRNKGYASYANAETNPVGPTDVDGIIYDIQAAVDKVKINTTATGALATNTTDAYKENQKLMDAIKTAAINAGFDDAEATALTTKLTATAGIAALTPTTGTNAFGTASQINSEAEWGYYKENLKEAIGAAIDERSETAATNTAFTLKADASNDLNGKETMGVAVATRNQGAAAAKANDELDKFWNGLRDTEKQKLQYAWGKAAMHNLANAEDDLHFANQGIEATSFRFNTALGVTSGKDVDMRDNDMVTAALNAANAKVSKMDFAGHTIETQEDAQQALNAINDAITQKDKVRAHLGALQNRLENTVSNLTVQSENLQAAESRISDVDVAKEMTNFVRNQILTQSAVAMLSQANSMPQMAMQLIG